MLFILAQTNKTYFYPTEIIKKFNGYAKRVELDIKEIIDAKGLTKHF